ncbi:helix-turn-helix domain-containing protein [Streptomyces sp. NPDC088770]|uniref:helix-turn-helix domain-containing protein n=1 Tax=unclassified Streptomyces TaxID=2593676 RepID=UPI00380E15CB
MSSTPPPDPRLLTFGMTLRRIREQQKLSIEDLAERSGLSFRGVIYIEHGRRNPSLLTILQLAAGLHVPPSALLEDLG